MASLSPKDRVSLCSFTFSDGRRCRTPRVHNHPHFCFYHAQKEARARAAESLGKDLAYFFSGSYLSACDLSTALGHLIPAVVRGDVKPRTARTVAYLAQTLLQAIHISQEEYCEAFDTDGWRKSIRNSVKGNYNYRFPPDPKPEKSQSLQPQPQRPPAQTPVNCRSSLATHHSPLPQTPQPAPSPHTPLPPTSAEFVQRVVAGLQTGSVTAIPQIQPAPLNPQPAETHKAPTPPPNSPSPTRPSNPPKATPSSPSAPLTATGATPPAPPRPRPSTPHPAQTGTPPGSTSLAASAR